MPVITICRHGNQHGAYVKLPGRQAVLLLSGSLALVYQAAMDTYRSHDQARLVIATGQTYEQI